MQLELELGAASTALNGPASDKTEAAYSRAYELSRRSGESLELLRALQGLRLMHSTRGASHKSLAVAEEALEIARRINDPAQLALAHSALAITLSTLAELLQARVMLEEALTQFASLPELSNLQLFRVATNVVLGRTLWLLGFPDQALKTIREAEIAGNRSTNPVAKAFALQPGEVHIWCGDFELVRENAQALLEAPWTPEINAVFLARADLARGWLMAREGKPDGIAMIRDALARTIATRYSLSRSMFAAMLAEACASVRQIDDALSVLDEALPFAQAEEPYFEAELNRQRGVLLLMQDVSNAAQAQQFFRTAIEISRRQKAKSWELRATTSLARLLDKQGHREEARAMLARIYNWFTEGFNTPDLKGAKALLDELKG
jgi:tetratricopeptide (TPR) repeat protein